MKDFDITSEKTLEIIQFIADRHHLSTEQAINAFLVGEEAKNDADTESVIVFEENEMAIMRDLGINSESIKTI